MLIFKTLTQKIKYRTQLELSVIIHESTIPKLTDNDLKLITFLSNPMVLEDNKYLNVNSFKTTEEYKHYMAIIVYWADVFKNLPIVKLDGRIKLGTYKLPDLETVSYKFTNTNLSLVVRSSERYKNQILEITNGFSI